MSRSERSRRTWWILVTAISFLGVIVGCSSVIAGMSEPTMTSPLPTTTSDFVLIPPTPNNLGQPTFILTPAPDIPPTRQAQPTTLPTEQPSLQEARTLTLEWPPVIRAGDSDIIRLTLEVDEMGNIVPTAEIKGHVVTGEKIVIPNLCDTHNVVAEARLDLAGMSVSPAEMSSQTLLPSQRITFYWSVHPEKIGKYLGVVWFYFRFVPLDGGPESERAVAAQQIEIQVISFLGLKAGPARILGMLGGFLGSVFGLPFMEDTLKWSWKRLRRGK